MNKIILTVILLLISACSYRADFGHKCLIQQQGPNVYIVESYVWFYHKDTGTIANASTCELLKK
jgi:hypothetical protein